jgi:hypothetical protein
MLEQLHRHRGCRIGYTLWSAGTCPRFVLCCIYLKMGESGDKSPHSKEV